MEPGMIKRVSKLLLNREIIVYIIAGALTTFVNLLVFTLMSRLFGTDMWWVSNFPAITASIIFAFWTNRKYVFKSDGPIWHEFIKFLMGRIFTALIFEYGAMFLLYNLLGLKSVISAGNWELSISKLLTQLFVMIGNYILSKLFVFNKRVKNE